MTVRVVVLGLVTPCLLVWAPPASSKECSHAAAPGATTFHAIGACHLPADGASSTSTSTSNGGTDTSTQVTYSYTPACQRGDGISGDSYFGCGDRLECGEGGHVYTVTAHLPDGTIRPEGQHCFQPAEEPPAAAELTAAHVLRAFERVPLPESELMLQPPGGETLVNLDTVFSTDAEGFTRTVGLLGHRVELDIRPAEFRWVQGDGTTQVTDWPGRAWQRGADLSELITHRYDDVGRALEVRVDTTWEADYRIDGGPWQPVPGTVTIEGQTLDLTVLAAEPRLTGG